MELTTIEDIEKALPKNSRFNITEDMLALINGMGSDCGIYQDYMIESFYSHIPVLREMTNVTTRTYVDAITRPFMKLEEGTAGYYFYDLNAKVNYEISDKDRIYLSSYFGRDKFSGGFKPFLCTV